MSSRLLLLAALFSLTACDGAPGAEGNANAAPKVSTAAPAPAGIADPVAKVNGKNISLAELDKKAAAGLIKARQAEYDARIQALNGMIDEQLLTAEASKTGKSIEEFIKTEVVANMAPVGDAEIEAFFNQNRQRIRGELDENREQISGYLQQQASQGKIVELIGTLREAAGVEVFLEAPRVHVDAGDSPRYGNAGAPIEIIEFSDFQCPYCSKGAATIDEVKSAYGEQVTVVFRHFPLPMHDRAKRAAEAAECANDQGKFWEFHDQLFANQRAMSEEQLSTYAGNVGMDVTAFGACLESGKHVATVEQDLEEGAVAGMSGTPGFFINGHFLGGALPFEEFKKIIDAELAAKAG